VSVEYWIIIVIGVGLIAAAVGFFGGRSSAAGEQQVREMAAERDAAKGEAEEMRAEVSRHFEESARMFGRLASDYRSFFEHFAQTAQNLGMSEGRARELLEQADPRLVDGPDGVVEGEATTPPDPPAADETRPTVEEPAAAEADTEPAAEESVARASASDETAGSDSDDAGDRRPG